VFLFVVFCIIFELIFVRAQVEVVTNGLVRLEMHVAPHATTYPDARACVVLHHPDLPAYVRLAAIKQLTLEVRLRVSGVTSA
jgi:hypothetical protein